MIKQLFSIGIALSLFSQMLWAQWTPVGDRIKTSWAEKIDVNNVLPEYPRPIMERSVPQPPAFSGRNTPPG